MCCVMPAAGGTGSVGSLVALWLAEHAASHVILLGRSGRHPPESQLATYTCVQTSLSLLGHGQHIRILVLKVRGAAVVHRGRPQAQCGCHPHTPHRWAAQSVYMACRGPAMLTTLRGDAALSEEAAWSLAAPGRAGARPLGAVMHAGAVLDPAVVTNISFRTVRAEYSGKVQHVAHTCREEGCKRTG